MSGSSLSSVDLKDYQLVQELFSTETGEDYFDQKRKKRLIKANLSSSLQQVQNVLTFQKSSFKDLSVPQLKEFFQNQYGVRFELELEFGSKTIEDVLKELASEKKCHLIDDNEGSVRIDTEFEDADIVTTRETLEKNLEEQKLLQVGYQGLYKVSLLESVTEIWIYNFSQGVQRLKLTEEMSKFYRRAAQHYQVQDRSKCEVGSLLAASYDQMVVRVVVQKIFRSQGQEMIKVFQVDYGTTVKVPMAQLFFLHRRFLSCPALVSKERILTFHLMFLLSLYLQVRLWGVRPVSGKKMEEVWALKELVREQMELGLGVEVMAVEEEKRKPSVIFHQLFGRFNLNFKLLSQGQGEVDPLHLHVDGKPGESVGIHRVLERRLQNLTEKVEQGPKNDLTESGQAQRMQQLLGDVINSLR